MAQAASTVSRKSRTSTNRRSPAVRRGTVKKSKARKKKVESLTKRQIENLILEHRESGRKLSRSLLRRWRVRMPLEEIDSIVDLTLCEAALRYNPTKGASFMTFLYYHLRGNLVRAITEATQSNQMFLNFSAATDGELSDWPKVVDSAACNVLPEHEGIVKRDNETPEGAVIRGEREDFCIKAFEKLDELEREVLSRSFNKEESLVDIAKSLGYSRCHISRVKKTALDRLKIILETLSDGDIGREFKKQAKPAVVSQRPERKKLAKRRSRRRNVEHTTSLRRKKVA